MRKWNSLFFLMLLSNLGWAQDVNESSKPSSTGYIIIGGILLVIVVLMLYSRQKRKYND